jgi:CheB methylesterase
LGSDGFVVGGGGPGRTTQRSRDFHGTQRENRSFRADCVAAGSIKAAEHDARAGCLAQSATLDPDLDGNRIFAGTTAILCPYPSPMVAIGASAGGLEVLRTCRIPGRMAFILVQHLDPGRQDRQRWQRRAKAIKNAGGLVIAQQPQQAEFDGMPKAAIASTVVDLVAPVASVPDAIVPSTPRCAITGAS